LPVSVSAKRFGLFMAPFHIVGDNPTMALRRDIELVEWADRLGFDEAWFGEHHSAGTEIIAAPDLMIAAVAERTRRIRLGTGVTSLPYHHPFTLADRMVQLDHMTMGRAILGVGPGALPGDAYMMGIDTTRQRPMMEECLEAVLALWRDEEPVNRSTDWFTLKDARLQTAPFTRPRMEVAVAATFSPSGPRLAGKFGLDLLSIAATQSSAFEVLARHWSVAQEIAAEHGQVVSREGWRLVGPMHLAETEEQARRDVERGLAEWVSYFRKVGAVPILGEMDFEQDLVDSVNASGVGVIGTVDRAVDQIERLEAQSGGFGTYLLMAHDWAGREETWKSYEFFSRYVMPRFQGSVTSLARSRDWTIEHRTGLIDSSKDALRAAIGQYKSEKVEREQDAEPVAAVSNRGASERVR
jgi:limonene 1,2-monooxygenase